MEKEQQRFVMKFLWLKGWGAKRIHKRLMSTLGDDSERVSQIKIWVRKFRNGDLSGKQSQRSGRLLLTLGPQLEAFTPKYSFARARGSAQHYLMMVPRTKDILQMDFGVRKFSRHRVPHFLSPAQKVARVEASKTILRVLQDPESNDFKGIATDDESWFRYCYPSSIIFARAPSEVLPRTRQKMGAKTMIFIFFTARQLIMLDVLPKGSKFNQQCFVDYVFPDSKTENRNFRLQLFGCTWIIQCVTMCQKSYQNSTSITLRDCRIYSILQT
jgi:hypothetical protein